VKIRATLLAAASTLAFVGTLAIPTAAHATTTFNVGQDHAVCNTLTGTLKFATKLTLGGPTTGTNTTTVKGTVAGCTDSDNGGVGMFSGTLGSTITTSGGSACLGLAGVSSNTGTAKIVWKPASGQAFTPVDPTTLKPTTNTSFTQTNGTTYTIGAGQGPWTGVAYGQFELGTVYGTTPLSITGATNDFKGGDGGISGWFNGTTQQDTGNILNSCIGKGLSSISFGIGASST
jgi:hypothetical protein